ncbi:hypothetical protein [uncultured Kocuria sp.]|nr:hypothetical protein [uncultured Kocuria sp.]
MRLPVLLSVVEASAARATCAGRKLSKDVFDLDSIINAAGELKYIGSI